MNKLYQCVDSAIILCAGASRRYGSDKLQEKFDGKTLPQRAIEFCFDNGINDVCVTLNKKDVCMVGSNITTAVKEDIEFFAKSNMKLRFDFQSPDEYGPAAALRPWMGRVGNTLILFGDNFYRGEVTNQFLFNVKRDKTEVVATVKSNDFDPRNLQLAAAVGNVLIEKPHGFVSGDFFCGFMVVSEKAMNNDGLLNMIEKSNTRDEYEITDFFNFAEVRKFVDIEAIGIEWADVTYQFDFDKVKDLASKRK